MKKLVLFVVSIFAFFSCDKPALPDNGSGKIKVQVCSRGCYQYLLETNGEVFFPDFVPESLKKDGQLVIFTGETSEETTTVLKPSPTDAPEPDFEAKNIHIVSMVEQ